MLQSRPILAFVLLLAVSVTSAVSGAFGQDQRIIDGAAIGMLGTDAPPGVHPRHTAISLWVANDDPDDIDDTLYEVTTDGTVIRSIPAPDHHPQGLVAGLLGGDPLGLTLFVTEDDPDGSADVIYEISTASGSVIRSYPASGLTGSLSPRALVESLTFFQVDPDSLPPGMTGSETVTEAWIANGDFLCLIDLASGSNIRSIPSPCASPQGLEIGTNEYATVTLWVACDDNDTIYLVSTADGSVMTSFPAPAAYPSGLALSLVDAMVPGTEVVILPLAIWQGENRSDTMEELTTTGMFIRRIAPECGNGPTAIEPTTWGRVKSTYRD